MSMHDLLKGLGKAVGESLVADLHDTVDKTIEDTKKRVQHATEQVLKRVIGFLFIMIGIIFGLVGLSMYLNASVPALAHGIGYLVVGVALAFLGWFAHYLSR